MSRGLSTHCSVWWYFLPVLLGVFGGVIAYFSLWRDDPPKAKNSIVLGLVLTVVMWVIWPLATLP